MEKRGLTDKLRDACGRDETDGIYWSDEMRVGLIGQVRKVWAPCGVKVVQEVQFVRKWIYLNLAVNGVEGRMMWNWTTNMKAESIAPVLGEWYNNGLDVVIWDRAPGHHGSLFDALLVTRIEQPPYSPELNPAERVFQLLRDKVEGKIYPTLQDKCKAIEDELNRFRAEPQRVRSLTGWKWIQDSIAAISAIAE